MFRSQSPQVIDLKPSVDGVSVNNPPVIVQPDSPHAGVSRSRTGMVWMAVCGAALVGVALIVFMVQNTQSTAISFLWMTTNAPLSLALLIAALGSAVLTLILGSVRIIQLRHQVRAEQRLAGN